MKKSKVAKRNIRYYLFWELVFSFLNRSLVFACFWTLYKWNYKACIFVHEIYCQMQGRIRSSRIFPKLPVEFISDYWDNGRFLNTILCSFICSYNGFTLIWWSGKKKTCSSLLVVSTIYSGTGGIFFFYWTELWTDIKSLQIF